MLLVFELFFVTSESPPCFPFLVPTLRLLDSFLLQNWCSELSTSLGKAWLHKNSFYANLWQSNEFIIKVLTVPELHFYGYLSTALTFILHFLFCIVLLDICVIFVLSSGMALVLKLPFKQHVNKYIMNLYFSLIIIGMIIMIFIISLLC